MDGIQGDNGKLQILLKRPYYWKGEFFFGEGAQVGGPLYETCEMLTILHYNCHE